MDKSNQQNETHENESPIETSLEDGEVSDLLEDNASESSVEVNQREETNLDTDEIQKDVYQESTEYLKPTQSTNNQKSVKKTRRFTELLALVLVLAVVGGFSIGAGGMFIKEYFSKDQPTLAPVVLSQPIEKTSVSTDYMNNSVDIAKIVADVGPSVVSITSNIAYRDFLNMERTTQASGSGVIYSVTADAVDILTNAHVIEGASEVLVQIKPDEYYKAEIVGKDKSTDLAILKIPVSDMPKELVISLKAATFGDSDALKVGETAIAIGNPLGYNSTVTVGVISAVDREIKDKNSLKLIQTDAAINPGNSGGALVNAYGEVIGINTIKISDTQVEGIGFAIPSNSILPIVNELISKGFVSRPYLGIYGAEITKEASETYDMPVGIYVRGLIEGSGSEKAGILAGDVIISVDGTRIETMAQLTEALSKYQVGDQVKVRLVRDSEQTVELNVTLMDVNS